MSANVATLQDTLDHLTTQLDRWYQGDYCKVNGEVEPLTNEHLEAGVYHDFELSPELVDVLRKKSDSERSYMPLPVADCGTSLCVAGDAAVRNGYTFVAAAFDSSSSQVVKTTDVERYIKDPYAVSAQEAWEVGREVLGLDYTNATRLFSGQRNLIEIWAIAFAASGGQLKLPDALPETRGYGGVLVTSALDSPAAVKRAVHQRLWKYVRFDDWRDYARFIDQRAIDADLETEIVDENLPEYD